MIADDHEQEFLEEAGAEQRRLFPFAIFREGALQHVGERFGLELRHQQFFEGVTHRSKHGFAVLCVEVENRLDIHAPTQAGCNDGAGAGSGEEVEMVR